MNKILLFFLAIAFIATGSFAQGEKSLKLASKSLSQYKKDPFGNSAVLGEMKAHLEEAFKDEMVAAKAKSWLTRGEIYFNIGDSQIKNKLLNPDAPLQDPDAGILALSSYRKAFDLAEKKGEKKDAIAGVKDASNLLNSLGVELYRMEDYSSAYATFKGEIEACNMLRTNEEECILDAGTQYNDKVYFAGLTAYYAKDFEGSIKFLNEAKDGGTDDASMYMVLYEAHKSLDKMDEGLVYLQQGREKFPDDSGLLFSEINHYLASGELDAMISKLQLALEKEPDNISVILTLGQVYDELQVKSTESGDREAANDYFNKSFDYYSQALQMDSENFDLNYSLGALFYNKAAGMTSALNEVANDFSPAGTKKYETIKIEMGDLFDQALPYFIKADELNSSDRNTIIALKEIYARKDNFEKSNAYKAKLEALPEN